MKTISQKLADRYILNNMMAAYDLRCDEVYSPGSSLLRRGEEAVAETRNALKSKSLVQGLFSATSILGLLASIAVFVFAYNRQLLTSQAALQAFIGDLGFTGVLLFILFQIVQVVIPIVPGGLGCLAGVLLFGPWTGLLYNYVGICIGSVAAFFIARHFGKPILYSLFSQKMIDKYESWTGSDSKFTKCFAIAIFLPVAPDDFLCYLAGTTQMKLSRFAGIIILGKPLAIALYSLGLYGGLQHFTAFIQ